MVISIQEFDVYAIMP